MHSVVTFVAKYFIVLSVLGAGFIWWRLKNDEKKQFIAFAVLGAILTLILAKIGSHVHSDPRPFVVGHFTPYFPHGADNGFPSDHTLLASFLAFTVWRYHRRAGVYLLILAILIGLSRVIAGIHHVQDIVGSIVFALIGTWIAWKLIEHFMPTTVERPRQRVRRDAS